ncbi:aconitase family protein, partial [Streptococcus suis]
RVRIYGQLQKVATAKYMALKVTQHQRKENVFGKLVEFFGQRLSTLTIADRATVNKKPPEYDPTISSYKNYGET